MSQVWNEKISRAKKGIKISENAIQNYKDKYRRSANRTSHCKTPRSKRMNANNKKNLKLRIEKAKRKIAKHRKAIQYYQGRKSGRIKASNLTMADFTR